jgi:hypothetical protein
VPRAPVFKIDHELSKLFERVLDFLIPSTLNENQKQTEKAEITAFIKKLNEIRKEYIDKDFSSSYVINNISMLAESNPFVSIIFQKPRVLIEESQKFQKKTSR